MDPTLLSQCVSQNVGDETFTSAFERTRRIIGVTVSPVELLQQGRLLNCLTAPNVLMSSAIMASCAIPGVFPSVMLEARDYQGQRVPYMPSKRWTDGTLSADLPMLRLARLHNVNHYIVSQTNPHVIPFMQDERSPPRGLLPFLIEVGRSNLHGTFKLANQHLQGLPAMRMADRLNGIIGQRYSGDINIFPRHSARQLLRMLADPSAEDIVRFMREGERATWPKIERIRDQTCISRAFETCIDLLNQRAREGRYPRSRSRPTAALRAVN
jgi:predicted acylesterase/phospholipase RssA